MANQLTKIDTLIKSLCQKLVSEYPEYFRIAYQEHDVCQDFEIEAHEFLKMDKCRLGRDFKLYELTQQVAGIESAIADFAYVLMAIRSNHPKAFEFIRQDVESWAQFFDSEMQQKWIELWIPHVRQAS